jgi:hypothetical protein
MEFFVLQSELYGGLICELKDTEVVKVVACSEGRNCPKSPKGPKACANAVAVPPCATPGDKHFSTREAAFNMGLA